MIDRNSGQRDLSPLSNAISAVLVATVALIVNLNTLSGGFVFDDYDNVLKNPWVREPGRLGEAFTHHMAAFSYQYDTSYYRPIMHVILSGAHVLFDLRPRGFHLVLVLLHAAASVTVFAVLTRFSPRSSSVSGVWFQPSGALLGALVFAAHPIHAEAVAWISGVVELSYSLLFLLALLATTSPSPSVRLALAPLLFLLALLSKEPAAMLLLVLASLFATRSGFADRARLRQDLVAGVALLGALIPYLILRLNALGGLMGTGGTHRVSISFEGGILTALALISKYVRLLVLPFGLSAVHDFRVANSLVDLRVWGGAAALAGIGLLAWRFRRNRSIMLGIALMLFPLLPALYVPVLGEGLLAERYLYLPSAGLALLVAVGWNAWPRSTYVAFRACTVVAALMVVACAAGTLIRNNVWHDDLSLWSDAARKSPQSAAAHEYLGFALYQSGRFASAVTSLSRALDIDPKRINARVNLAAALAALGRTREAISQAQFVLFERPRMAEVHGILGFALASEGRLDEAVAAYRRALAIDPYLAPVHNNLGIVLARQGDLGGAALHFKEAMRIEPNNPDYARNLSLLRVP
jgi:Flp pilus assembly protein TadD